MWLLHIAHIFLQQAALPFGDSLLGLAKLMVGRYVMALECSGF